MDREIEPVMHLFRRKIETRGARGIIGLGRLFKILDDDRSGKLDKDEFTKAIREYKLGLELNDIHELFKTIDVDHTGYIDYEEFLRSARGEMNSFRKALINKAFDRLDIDHSGIVDSNDIKELYNPSKHPAVLANRKTEDQILQEFLETFELHHNLRSGQQKDYKITRDEFIEYYNNISCSIDSDEYFETMINNTWNLTSKPEKPEQKAWAQDMGKFDEKPDAYNKRPHRSERHSEQNIIQPQEINEDVKSTYTPSHTNKARELQGSEFQKSPEAKPKFGNMVNVDLPKYQNIMLERFRTKLIGRGIRGAFGLERQFHIFDLDESGALSRDEFKKAVNDYKIEMDERDLNNLFRMFDKNSDGKISYEEFMITIVGQMNEFRKNMTERAFENLDINGEGAVDFAYAKDIYKPEMHPDVKLGKKTEDEELNEFVSTFTSNHNGYGGPETKVTKDEFMDYYTKVSAAIESDSHFDLIMTDVWGLGIQANLNRIPYAGASSKIYQVNSKNIWKYDHHREMITGDDPLKHEETKHTKSIYEMSCEANSPSKYTKSEAVKPMSKE